MNKNNKGQVAIFVIIALILVISIALVFVLVKDIDLSISPTANPVGYVEVCVIDAIEEAIEILLPQAGYLEVEEPYLVYDDSDVSFLCYVEGTDEICTNLEPMLTERIEEEIAEYIEPRINSCFSSLKNELQQYDYKQGPMSFNVELKPEKVYIQISKEISFTINDETQTHKSFDPKLKSSLYEFSLFTNQIINDEVNCECGQETCNADIIEIYARNSDFEFEKFVTGGNEEVYVIRDEKLEEEFVFAIRNCIRLPGN